MAILHITPGDSSYGSLKMALKKRNLRERAFRLPFNLTYWPILDFPHTAWQSRYLDWLEWEYYGDDEDAEQRTVLQEIMQEWNSNIESVSENDGIYLYYTLSTEDILMALLLSEYFHTHTLHTILVNPPHRDLRCLGELDPETFSHYIKNHSALQEVTRDILVAPLVDAGIRLLNRDHMIENLPIDAYDAYILSHCPENEPRRSIRVVGDCLGGMMNTLDDGFFLWRISVLEQQKKIFSPKPNYIQKINSI